MKHLLSSIFFILLTLLSIWSEIFLPDYHKLFQFIQMFICELFIVAVLIRRPGNHRLLLIAMIFLWVADSYYHLQTLMDQGQITALKTISELSYSLFALGLLGYSIQIVSKNKNRFMLPAFLFSFAMLVLGTVDLSLFQLDSLRNPSLIAMNSHLYSFSLIAIVSLAIPQFFTSLKPREFAFWQIIVLFAISDFGIREGLAHSWPQILWQAALGALSVWSIAFGGEKLDCYKFSGFRSKVGWAFFGSHLILLAGVAGGKVEALPWIYSSWLFSHWISLKLNQKVENTSGIPDLRRYGLRETQVSPLRVDLSRVGARTGIWVRDLSPDGFQNSSSRTRS